MLEAAGADSGSDSVDVGGALGYADGASRVEEVEDVRALQGEVERGVNEGGGSGVGGEGVGGTFGSGSEDAFRFVPVDGGFDDALRLSFVHFEKLEEHRGVGDFEVVDVVLGFELPVDVAVGCGFVPHQVVPEAFAAVEHEAEALGAVGDFGADGVALDAAHLLEERELGDFRAVDPDFPAHSARASCLAFPVVFDEADVVLAGFEAEGIEGAHVEVHDVLRGGLHDDLVLVVALAPLRISGVAAIGGAAGGLHVGDVPGFGAEHAESGGRVHGARADFDVVRLQDRATLGSPVVVEAENHVLHRHRGLRIPFGQNGLFGPVRLIR